MLSGETAAGEYPIEAVSTMALIAETTEYNIDYKSRFHKKVLTAILILQMPYLTHVLQLLTI